MVKEIFVIEYFHVLCRKIVLLLLSLSSISVNFSTIKTPFARFLLFLIDLHVHALDTAYNLVPTCVMRHFKGSKVPCTL